MIDIDAWLEVFCGRLDDLPEREKICGFVSGRDELMHWETSDLFQFCRDTLPIRGSLVEVLALVSDEAVKRAVLSGSYFMDTGRYVKRHCELAMWADRKITEAKN